MAVTYEVRVWRTVVMPGIAECEIGYGIYRTRGSDGSARDEVLRLAIDDAQRGRILLKSWPLEMRPTDIKETDREWQSCLVRRVEADEYED